jgi:hypothetical protein
VNLFADGWLVFDFTIIVLSWSVSGLQVIRSFRIFRAFRLVTRISVLRNLVLALFAVTPSMMAIIALFVLLLYIYAVMCTVLFGDMYENKVLDVDYFGTLDKSLFTLFTMMTLEWADVVRAVMTEYEWAWCIFTPFLVMSSFILYSLMIAVICDAVKVTEHAEELEEEHQEKEEFHEHVHRLEERLMDMTTQQQVLLEALQQALAQVDYQQQQQHQLYQHHLSSLTSEDEDGIQLWQWSGDVLQPTNDQDSTLVADTSIMPSLDERLQDDTPERSQDDSPERSQDDSTERLQDDSTTEDATETSIVDETAQLLYFR